MTVIGLVGGKHSAGVTTLALALAASARVEARPLVVEADPAGGDIAPRAGLGLDPGLLTLAAAGRHGLSESLIESHAQPFGNGVRVLVGPSAPEQAAGALAGCGQWLGVGLARQPWLTIIDAGRWEPRSPAAELLGVSTLALLVLRPTVEGVEHARSRLASLSRVVDRVGIAVVGERPYPPADVGAVLGVDDVFAIEDDPRAAAAIGAGTAPDRWLRRSALLRSAAAILRDLHDASPERSAVAE